eukprot:GFUD01032273.1.p1 GENE.GFUD01032273.1~~GFUD01032273.1.p1  ORF type:complete len:590 (+),score=186.75 GFUD01032273.1:44-1813(+)
MGTHSEDIAALEIKLRDAEQRATDNEAMMMQAAQYGKGLLDKNMELDAQCEAAQQEKYECNLKLQAKMGVEKTMLNEVDNLREAIKHYEVQNQKRELEDEEKWAKREEIWKAKLGEVDSALQASETREKGLAHRLDIADKQLREANDILNQSVGGQSFSAEFGDLQVQNVDLMMEKQTLESELGRVRAELEQEKSKVNSASARIELLQRELEELQCEITGYVRAVEGSKTEVMELEAQLEAVRAGELNEDGKGNSLFSEVNDRREKVETQLKVYSEKYETLKENYDIKLAQLQKTKMHNAQLLSIAGTRQDTGHAARLEELLTAERNKNKTLRDRLDNLEKLGSGQMVTIPFQASNSGKGEGQEIDDSVVVQHTATEEYAYLSTILTETQKNNAELQKQLQQQFRQNLEDSDKLRDMTRKVNQSETSLQKLRADNYTLKMQVDELKCKKGDQKVAKKEPVKIVEMLKFDKKKPEPLGNVKKEQFVLKEKVVNKPISNISDPPPVLDNVSPLEEKENLFKTEGEKPRKKSAMFADTVEEISAEGETESAKLKDDAPKPKIRPSRPQGKKQFGSKNTVMVAEQEGAECKQQ